MAEDDGEDLQEEVEVGYEDPQAVVAEGGDLLPVDLRADLDDDVVEVVVGAHHVV